jgi:3-oxo-5-alpha-steroid 4-dehydrogenase 1
MISTENLLYAWIGLALITFLYLLRKNAPYGRHQSPGWGPTIPNRMGWIIMEGFVLLVFWAWFWYLGMPQQPQIWLLCGLFSLHYLHRSFVFPFRLRTQGKTMPVLIMGSAMLFNLVNGSVLGWDLSRADRETLDTWNFNLGFMLFVLGFALNYAADSRLIALRKPGETGYKIPDGPLFRRISCPNLLGEIIEWGGFALMCGSLAGLSFWVWTLANLLPRALAHHRWYKQRFPEYPSERKAIFPFLL